METTIKTTDTNVIIKAKKAFNALYALRDTVIMSGTEQEKFHFSNEIEFDIHKACVDLEKFWKALSVS